MPAITATYAFTDYKSQGQTIEYVIVDLGKPASGELNGFNAYMALSRRHHPLAAGNQNRYLHTPSIRGVACRRSQTGHTNKGDYRKVQ